MTNEDNRIISEARWGLHRVIDKALILSRSPGDYGTGERLNLAEIRIIYTVGSNPGINITELSNEIGVGKSTVSPMVNRLYKKQYIKKLKEVSNKKNILLELTEKGTTAREGFERFHQDFIWRHAQNLAVEQYSAFNEVLRRVEEYLDSQLNGS
ncbi:MAG: MarR family transcriptional regulator [Chloroflexi bacterium]|nr:MarR family transcriptional regulator [Chloroflexota bacterium]